MVALSAPTWISSVVEAQLQHVTLLAFQELPLTQLCLTHRTGLATLLEGKRHIDFRQEAAMTCKDPDTKIDFIRRLLRLVWPSGILDQADLCSFFPFLWVFQASWSFASDPFLLYLHPVGRVSLLLVPALGGSQLWVPSCLSYCVCLLGVVFDVITLA